MTTSTMPEARSKRVYEPKPRSPADEIKYQRAMIEFMAERGCVNLAQSHMIAMLEAMESAVTL